MATHRYWRAVSIESYSGGALEITAFHLLSDTTRVDAPATLTANIDPSTGMVENLQDDDTGAGSMWDSSKGLVLQWDLGGSPVDVTDIRLGAADDIKTFPLIGVLQWSDDNAAWSLGLEASGIAWPGARSKTVSISGVIVRNKVHGKVTASEILLIPSSGATPDFSGVKLIPPLTQDTDYAAIVNNSAGWGNGRITGTVKETGTPNIPVFKRVRLHRMVDGMLVREQWSDAATGAYAFNNIDATYKFYVISHDHLTNYNAVIKDNLTPEPMP